MTDLRNLPGPVLERLAAHTQEMRANGFEVVQRGNLLEARSGAIEHRSNEDGTVGLSGYATVYDYPYQVGGSYGWEETMVAGAATKSCLERDDVRCLFNHDGIPVARTKSGTMQLTSDSVGLLTVVPSLDVCGSPFVQSLVSALDRCDLDEMSIAFQVLRQEWNGDYTQRRILEIKLFDASVVTYPANPATVVGLDATSAVPVTEPRGMSLAYALALADQSRFRG